MPSHSRKKRISVPPYPMLQEGDLSFPQGKYSPEIEMGVDGHSATVQHVIEGAPLVARLIEEKRAAYACSVAIPVASYRRFHHSEDKVQGIAWDEDIIGEPAILHPMVVCLKRLQCKLSPDDGVGEAWRGRSVLFEVGSKIALGSSFPKYSSLQSLLSVVRGPELRSGQLTVESCSEHGFYFTVHVAADLHDFFQRWGNEEHRLHRNSIFTHVVSRCFELLVKEYGKEKSDGEEGWRSHGNLVALASELENRGLPIWDDDSFVPEKVATALQPHVVPRIEGRFRMNPCQFDDRTYTAFQRSLLEEKGSGFQRDFLQAARQSADFLVFVQNEVVRVEGDDIPIYGNPLTEHEYKEPPPDTEYALYSTWKEITPAVACRPAFWAEVTFRHIENNRIEASYLAAGGGSQAGGLERIERVLKEASDKAVDDCVRTILRRMSGLRAARGNRSPYVDCPFGRAWWRGRVAEEICSSTDVSRENVLGILRLSQGYWEELVSQIVSRNSVVGDKKVRDALVVCLIAWKGSNPDSPIFKVKELHKLIKLLGIRSAWQELGVLGSDDLIALISKEIKAVTA